MSFAGEYTVGMITYTVTGDNVDISDAVRDYVREHYQTFEKFLKPGEDREIAIMVSRNTDFQRENTFKIEARFITHGGDFFASGENADVISGIDAVKDSLMREVTKSAGRKRTVFHRGARKLKNFTKGLFGG